MTDNQVDSISISEFFIMLLLATRVIQ